MKGRRYLFGFLKGIIYYHVFGDLIIIQNLHHHNITIPLGQITTQQFSQIPFFCSVGLGHARQAASEPCEELLSPNLRLVMSCWNLVPLSETNMSSIQGVLQRLMNSVKRDIPGDSIFCLDTSQGVNGFAFNVFFSSYTIYPDAPCLDFLPTFINLVARMRMTNLGNNPFHSKFQRVKESIYIHYQQDIPVGL